MAAHSRLEYYSDLEDELADEVFEKYWEGDNPSLSAVKHKYVIFENEDNFYVDEVRKLNGNISVERALIYDLEEVTEVIRGRLE
ncbi:MAG: hypothetical protein H8Z69_00570 [Nanohaloarchaea archaeon]|nr:hypothetical protein [Candidatus Nanohaloarchaea archaeon]